MSVRTDVLTVWLVELFYWCNWQIKKESSRRVEELDGKLADLQTLHNALMSDNDNYQQLLEQLTADNGRLEELLRARTETADQLQAR